MHVMIDIETMGVGPDAPIVAIGAVGFHSGGLVGGLYYPCDLHSAVQTGAVMDPSTVLWWMKQSDEARKLFTDTQNADDLVGLNTALYELRKFITDLGPDLRGVWGNGATFDNVIVRRAYERLDMTTPWPFWLDRCYRTVKNMFPTIEMEREGTHHNAADDARSQALHLIAINAAHGEFL